MQIQSSQLPIVVGITHRNAIQPLTEAEIRFEIDMCIGCDRCMRACPIPLSVQVNIADLNRANISDEILPHVARFVDECVMCGSCVPVCPVNNHRDLLMLSLKQRQGVSWNDPIDLQQVQAMLPTGLEIARVLQLLREQAIFSDSQTVPDNYLLHMIAASQLHMYQPEEIVAREGDFDRSIYFLLRGRCELATVGFAGEPLPVAIVRRGEYFGEQGMLSGMPHAVTASAQTVLAVLAVPEQVMQRLMELVPTIQHFFAQLNSTRSIEAILKRIALFQGIASDEVHQLAEQAEIIRYDRDELLFSEDKQEQPDRETLHILLDGFVKVARRTAPGIGRAMTDERIIAYRQLGDYFAGGLDMLGDRQAVSVTAITRTSVARLSRHTLLALFKHYPEVEQRFYERLKQYRTDLAAAYSGVFDPFASDPVNTMSVAEARADLHALVQGGVVEGTEVLVIDLDKCIHCSECEEACARRHGQSRMNRNGLVVGNISIATACRQCQDPVCMLCSRAGIARLPGGEVYITESCIGCGICAERCPYDNISIVDLVENEDQDVSSARVSWQHFADFFTKGMGKERGRKMLPMAQSALGSGPLQAMSQPDLVAEMRKKVAVKCDLCAGYNNQACVQACPTGAAIRVNPASFFGSTEEILRKRA